MCRTSRDFACRTPNPARLTGTLTLLLLGTIPAQQPDDAGLVAARRALDAWLASDQTDRGQLDQVVSAALAAGTEAIDHIGERARAARKADDPRLGRGLDAVITHMTVAFLKRETESGITFAGQYEPLRGLQPFVGKLLLRLLVDTPDWFSQQERHLLVFPLRDVYPQSPGADVCKQLHEIAADEDYEPEPVRQNLAFALAQWGDRSFIDARIARVEKEASQEGLGADRRAALRYELADIHYTLRDYARAAGIHVDLLRRAEATDTPLVPVNYYNAACCLARAGQGEAALDELQRAARLMRDGNVDPSQMLEKKLFEGDPDLASVRGSERFAKIVAEAFAKQPGHAAGAVRKDG
ncbi:MAG: hypothetical protein R3F56_22085 [Planctomycetota bacterium]